MADPPTRTAPDPGPGRPTWALGVLVALAAGGAAAHFGGGRVALAALCLLLSWVWLTGDPDHKPRRRHPVARKAAAKAWVKAWRRREAWLPTRRAPTLWAGVFAGFVALGTTLALMLPAPEGETARPATEIVWWALTTPTMALAVAFIFDSIVLMIAAFWLVMVPIALLFLAIPFTLGPPLDAALGLGAFVAAIWLSDLARALYQAR